MTGRHTDADPVGPLARGVRRLALALIVLGAVVAVGGVSVLDLYDNEHRDSQNIQKERIEREVEVNGELKQLACTLIVPFPDTTVYAKNFRAKYGCPPYSAATARTLLQQPGGPPRGQQPTSSTRSKANVNPLTTPGDTPTPAQTSSATKREPTQAPSSAASSPRTKPPRSSSPASVTPTPTVSIGVCALIVCVN